MSRGWAGNYIWAVSGAQQRSAFLGKHEQGQQNQQAFMTLVNTEAEGQQKRRLKRQYTVEENQKYIKKLNEQNRELWEQLKATLREDGKPQKSGRGRGRGRGRWRKSTVNSVEGTAVSTPAATTAAAAAQVAVIESIMTSPASSATAQFQAFCAEAVDCPQAFGETTSRTSPRSSLQIRQMIPRLLAQFIKLYSTSGWILEMIYCNSKSLMLWLLSLRLPANLVDRRRSTMFDGICEVRLLWVLSRRRRSNVDLSLWVVWSQCWDCSAVLLWFCSDLRQGGWFRVCFHSHLNSGTGLQCCAIVVRAQKKYCCWHCVGCCAGCNISPVLSARGWWHWYSNTW